MNLRSTSLLLVLLLVCFVTTSHAQIDNSKFNATLDKFLKPKTDTLQQWTLFARTDSKQEYNEFVNFIKHLRDFYRMEIDLNGSVGVSFNSDFNDTKEITNIGTAFAIDKGVFPIEADFSANFQTIFQENLVQQRISNLDLSIDYHPFKNSTVLENYSYANRYADSFLGINQRFEVGGGMIVNGYVFGLNAEGSKHKENLGKIDHVPAEIIKIYNLKGDDVKNLISAQSNFLNSNTKRYSKWRFALLTGIFYELEDSKAIFSKEQIEQYSLPDTINQLFKPFSRFNWTLRPTLEYRPNKVLRLTANSYIKGLGLPGQIYTDITGKKINDKNLNQKNILLDNQINLAYKLGPKTSLVLRYRKIIDYAPRGIIAFDDTEDKNVVVLGENTHTTIVGTFSFRL